MYRAIVLQLALLLVLVAATGGVPPSARAECSAGEMVSVVLLGRIDFPDPIPDFWTVDLVHVSPRGPISDPEDPEIFAAINSTFGTNCPQELRETAGDYRLYWGCAWDFITVSIVDGRTGRIPFGGWTHWAGTGSLVLPGSSTHGITVLPDPPAAGPAEVTTIPNSLWEIPNGTADALAVLLETDLLHAYAACGDYTVTGYTYTPTVGTSEEEIAEKASQVIIVRGHLEPPWAPVSVRTSTWGEIKALYR